MSDDVPTTWVKAERPMGTIYKYEASITDKVEIVVPWGATLLEAGFQNPGNHVIAFWYYLPDRNEEKRRTDRYIIYGTGFDIPVSDEFLDHVGTYAEGPFMWHVFELLGEIK